MKINNETKVGLLAIVSIAVLIIGFNFLKGRDFFKKKNTLYAVFENVGSLDKSNPVKIQGLVVGKVYEIEPVDKKVSGVKVTVALDRELDIPTNSVIYIEPSLLGTPTVVIKKGDAATFLEKGSQIQVRQGAGGGMLSTIAPQLDPVLTKVGGTLDSLNGILGSVNKIFNEQTQRDLQQAIANLNTSTAALHTMLTDANGSINSTLDNASAITGNLRKSNDSITAILSNAKIFTNNLAKVDLNPTIDSAQAAIGQLKMAMNKMTSTDGTLGALINDKQLYNKLNNTMLSAEILLDDLRAHPKRYVNISVFGRKDKGGALTSPLKKDSVAQEY